ILTLAEVEFIKAELAQKGYWDDAEEHFKKAVRAAVELWTKETLSDGYFDNPYAQYDGSLERIIMHKYLALYFTDNQQWADYRRTGYPVLPKTSSMLYARLVASRLLCPDVLKRYNRAHNEDASRGMGGDNINSKVWWALN